MSNAVVATILRTECDFTPDMTGEQIIREAFKKAKNHWMEPNENNQFSAACAVAYAAMNDDDKSRMEKSTKMLKALSAMMAGIPVDLEALMGDERGTLFNAISGLGGGGENKPPLKRKADSALLPHQCANPGTFNTFGFFPTKSTDELSTLRGLRSWDFNGFQTATVNLARPA